MKQVWLVRCERLVFGTSCIEFEMVFTNREDAVRVYKKGVSAGIPQLDWTTGTMIIDNVEYAESEIDMMAKEQKENNE